MKLKEIRKSKCLTQEEASEITKIPLRTYKRYENDAELENSSKYIQIINAISSFEKSNSSKKTNKYKVAVFGIGYVGLSIGVLLAKKHSVTMIDIVDEKINCVNSKICPFKDNGISDYFSNKKLDIKACKEFDGNADFAIIATPTNFNYETNKFDTASVENVYSLIRKKNKKTIIVIKSTIPIGYSETFNDRNVLFSPEFLREGHALEDNLRPSRIIVGHNNNLKAAKAFGSLLRNETLNQPNLLLMSTKEAESVKLFSNSYLAMRVAYFNELDSFMETNGLDSKNVIEGISLDPRIGDYYNNPSFGYGGYCLPKDTKQLKSSFLDIPNNNLIRAIVESNQTRKQYIAKRVVERAKQLSKKPTSKITIGVYRLIMKTGSDNYRSSAVLDIINNLKITGVKIIVYEINKPGIDCEITNSLEDFKLKSDLIITNRNTRQLNDVKHKVYTRDIFSRD